MSPFSGARTRAGLTLVELLLALAISSLVAVAVSGMVVATSYGTASKRDLRGVVVRGRLIETRLSAVLRGSRAILETGTDYLVVWTGDINTNGTADAPDLSEIRLIERDSGTKELRSYRFPDSWTQAQIDAADAAYQLTGNPAGFFQTATANAKTAGSFQPTLWGTGVATVQFTLDGAGPDTTRMVSYRVTLEEGDLSETVVGAAAARYPALK